MMEKTKKSPIGLMADALAEMTERALEAERQRDAALEDAHNWYMNFLRKDEKLTETISKLDAEIAEHQKTREALQHALSPARDWED